MDWFIYNALKGIGGVAGLMWLLALVYGPYACAFEDCSNLSGWWVALYLVLFGATFGVLAGYMKRNP